MSNAAATTIRQRLDALKPQVLAVATRHGASNLRIYGSIATGREHPCSDLDLLVDLPEEQSLLGCSVDVTEAETLHPLIRTQILEQALENLADIKEAVDQQEQAHGGPNRQSIEDLKRGVERLLERADAVEFFEESDEP